MPWKDLRGVDRIVVVRRDRAEGLNGFQRRSAEDEDVPAELGRGVFAAVARASE